MSYINILSNLLKHPNFSLELLIRAIHVTCNSLWTAHRHPGSRPFHPPNFSFLMTLPIAKIQMKNPSIIPFTPFSWGQTTTHQQDLFNSLGYLWTQSAFYSHHFCLGDCRHNPLVPLLPVLILSISSSHTVRVIMLKCEADHITPLLRTFRESDCFQYQA